jgi:hypothetical protein
MGMHQTQEQPKSIPITEAELDLNNFASNWLLKKSLNQPTTTVTLGTLLALRGWLLF